MKEGRKEQWNERKNEKQEESPFLYYACFNLNFQLQAGKLTECIILARNSYRYVKTEQHITFEMITEFFLFNHFIFSTNLTVSSKRLICIHVKNVVKLSPRQNQLMLHSKTERQYGYTAKHKANIYLQISSRNVELIVGIFIVELLSMKPFKTSTIRRVWTCTSCML